MRVLLDMHTFLWCVLGDPRLTPNAKASREEPGNEKVVSPASYWEIAIKVSLGKYTLSKPYEEFMARGIVKTISSSYPSN
jgi:PIN domain nuclease of toxin-antitoxin system